MYNDQAQTQVGRMQSGAVVPRFAVLQKDIDAIDKQATEVLSFAARLAEHLCGSEPPQVARTDTLNSISTKGLLDDYSQRLRGIAESLTAASHHLARLQNEIG